MRLCLREVRQRKVPWMNPKLLAFATKWTMPPSTKITAGVGWGDHNLMLKRLRQQEINPVGSWVWNFLERFGSESKMHMPIVIALFCDLYKQIINRNVEFLEIPWNSF